MKQLVNQEVQRIIKEEMRAAMNLMKTGKAVGRDYITVKKWPTL